MNDIAINVVGYDGIGETGKRGLYPLRRSKFCHNRRVVHLLLLQNEYTSHYVYVKSLSGLLSTNSTNRHKKFVCFNCFHRFKYLTSIMVGVFRFKVISLVNINQ